MKIKIDERQQALLQIQKLLFDIEKEQNNGATYYSLEELDEALRKIVDNT